MRQIWVVALNTFKEVIRDRILYGLFLFAIMIIGTSLALGQLSFAEQVRISANFSMMAIHLSAASIAIFVGSNLVVKELDKQTILTVLTRPLSRTQFILGKFLGLSLVILEVMFGLGICLVGVFFLLGMSPSIQLAVALFGIFLEALVLLGFSLVFSIFARPLLVVCFSIGVFFIGHWFSSLKYFSDRVPHSWMALVYKAMRFGIPDLELVNWKTMVVYGDAIPVWDCASASIYLLFWIAFLVALTAALFERKDLV